jgi:hypothetical protein
MRKIIPALRECCCRECTLKSDLDFTFRCRIDPENDSSLSFLIKSHENTSLWNFGHFQFVIVIIAISVCSQYRKPLWTNKWFSYYSIFIFSLLSLQLLFMENKNPSPVPYGGYDTFLSAWFNVAPGIPFSFRALQFLFILLHLISAIILELAWNWYRHERLRHGDDRYTSVEFLPLI